MNEYDLDDDEIERRLTVRFHSCCRISFVTSLYDRSHNCSIQAMGLGSDDQSLLNALSEEERAAFTQLAQEVRYFNHIFRNFHCI